MLAAAVVIIQKEVLIGIQDQIILVGDVTIAEELERRRALDAISSMTRISLAAVAILENPIPVIALIIAVAPIQIAIPPVDLAGIVATTSLEITASPAVAQITETVGLTADPTITGATQLSTLIFQKTWIPRSSTRRASLIPAPRPFCSGPKFH